MKLPSSATTPPRKRIPATCASHFPRPLGKKSGLIFGGYKQDQSKTPPTTRRWRAGLSYTLPYSRKKDRKDPNHLQSRLDLAAISFQTLCLTALKERTKAKTASKRTSALTIHYRFLGAVPARHRKPVSRKRKERKGRRGNDSANHSSCWPALSSLWRNDDKESVGHRFSEQFPHIQLERKRMDLFDEFGVIDTTRDFLMKLAGERELLYNSRDCLR